MSQPPAGEETIDMWHATQAKTQIDREVLEYAAAMAGTADDLDPELEAAGLELWSPIE